MFPMIFVSGKNFFDEESGKKLGSYHFFREIKIK